MTEESLKILMLEDSEDDAGLIIRELKKLNLNFIYKVVDSEKDFTEALNNFIPDIILSDHSLPHFNSLEALYLVKEQKQKIPFILVTGTVSEEFAVLCLKEGANDYILKDNLKRLPSAVLQAIKARNAEREQEKTMQQLTLINNELNTFIYRVTHDLRGPLCSVMGLVELVKKEKENANLYINRIGESTARLDRVLLLLLDIMSIRDSNLEIKEINFDRIIKNILNRFEIMDLYSRIKIQVKNITNKIIYSDEKILSLVLQRILENSINYQNLFIENSFILINISDVEGEFKIEIIDNGVGIDPVIQHKIFGMFYKGLPDSKGPGLGLYVVKKGVEKLGGRINVKSEKDIGTTFTIHLPVIDNLL